MSTLVDPILKAPLNVEWEITKACNLRCRHCYTSAGVKEREELQIHDVLHIIDHLDYVGISDITISGGEPLLRNDLEVIIAEITRREIPVALYTNGLLLSQKRQQSLKKAGVRTFSLSLNGVKRETHNFVHGADTFDIVMEKITQLKNDNLHAHALYTLMKVNLKEASELPFFMDKIGLDSLCIYPFYPAGRGAHHLADLEAGGEELCRIIEELLKDKRIYLGGCLRGIFNPTLIKGSPCAKLMCVITSEGRLRPCNFLPFTTEESLLQKDIYKLWKSPVFEKIRTWQSAVEKDCQSCEYVKLCKGKCLAFHMPFLKKEEEAHFEST